MKILKVEIVGFGRYRQQVFHFTEGNQLLYGPNEIGKSTLYQFIQAILFGFPPKRGKQKDYTPKDGAAFGGRLLLAVPGVGEVLLERFKQVNRGKVKVTLPDGKTGEEKLLKGILQGLTPQLFTEVFTFQQEQLSQLEFLQEDELQQALISLGLTGSQQLVLKSQRYLANSQKLFKPKGQRLPINELLQKWQQLTQQVQGKEATEATLQQRLAQQVAAKNELSKVRKNLRQAQQKNLALKDQELHWQQYQEWQDLKKLKAKMQPLKSGQIRQLQEIYQSYQNWTQQLAGIDQQYHQAKSAEEVTPQYEFYLQHEQVIKELLTQQVTGVRVTDQFQQLMGQQEELLNQIDFFEEKYGWKINLPEELNLPLLEKKFVALAKSQAQLEKLQLEIQWQKEHFDQLDSGNLPSAKPLVKALSWWKKPMTLSILAAGIFLVAGIGLFPKQKALFGIGAIICGLGASWLYYHQKQQRALKDYPAFQETGEKPAVKNFVTTSDSQQQLAVEITQLTSEIQQLLKIPAGKAKIPVTANPQSYQQEVALYLQALEKLEAVTESLQQQDQMYGQLMATFDFAQAWLPLQDLDLVARFSYLQQFDQKMSRQKQLQSQQQTTLLANQRQQLTKKLEELSAAGQPLLKAANLGDLKDIPQFLQKEQVSQQQALRLEELTKNLQGLFPEKLSKTDLTKQLAANQQSIQQLQQEESHHLESLQRQNVQLEILQQDGTLDELRQKLAELEEQLYQQLIVFGGGKIAQAVLTDLATDLSSQQLPQLLAVTGKYLSQLTKGKYQQLSFQDGLLVLKQGQENLNLYQLSTGTKDQVIMAIRFGYLELQSHKILAPVIIDDGWLHYDSQRKESLASALAQFGKKYQVICLSSDREMVSYYQKLQQPVKDLQKGDTF